MTRKPDTYAEWDTRRMTGRKGRKKIRRDVLLERRDDDMLTFTYDPKHGHRGQLLLTLDVNDTYTVYWDNGRYYPTYSNIYALIAKLTVYSDMSHFKRYANPIRISTDDERWEKTDDDKWTRAKGTMPFTNGLQFRHGECLNPEIAIDYKRTLNRAKSLPLLRKTETLAKLLRVAVRMGILERDKGWSRDFTNVNIDDTTTKDAEIILHAGRASGAWRSQKTLEDKIDFLKRCAENGLADFREWLYNHNDCYDMLPVEVVTQDPTKEK